MTNKKILYIDMDNVLVDFKSGIAQLDEKKLAKTLDYSASSNYFLW